MYASSLIVIKGIISPIRQLIQGKERMAKLNASSNMFTITIDYYYVLQRVKSRLLGLIQCFVGGQMASLRLHVGQLVGISFFRQRELAR